MHPLVLHCHLLFLLLLCLNSGSRAAQPLKEHNKGLQYQQNKALLSTSTFASQRDTTAATIPIVNPTTPGTSTPIVNPASPPPPITTMPIPSQVAPPTTTTPTTSSGQWCVANPGTSQTALQVALDYACGYGGADCASLQPGATCYDPNTLQDHASYAFNDYYQKNPVPTSCVFGGTAQLTSTDPSHGSCHFASSGATLTPTPPTLTPPTTATSPPPPMTYTTPVYQTPPSTVPGSPLFGVPEPTGLPSSATSITCSLAVLLIAACLSWSLLARGP
ncbi:hypothetical protein NL676_008758 [Syzygium grande]|nr:hypothetical protein NL676_008758 [Syzygium grande]